MLDVYAIYCMRKLRSPFFAESFIFIILAIILTYFVSVPSVLMNVSTSESFYNYFVKAFFSTELLIQSVLVLAVVTVLFLVRNITVHAVFKERFT